MRALKRAAAAESIAWLVQKRTAPATFHPLPRQGYRTSCVCGVCVKSIQILPHSPGPHLGESTITLTPPNAPKSPISAEGHPMKCLERGTSNVSLTASTICSIDRAIRQ